MKDAAAEKARDIANAAKDTIASNYEATKQESQQVKDRLGGGGQGQRRDAEL